jgi:hypothetical protein
MAAGRFRSDLFYRLGVFNVHLPPLRERGDDVLLLADSFIRSLAAKMGKGDVTLSRDARELLRRHAWPGNIRELQNAIERALITCEGTLVTAAHLAIPLPSEPIRPPGSPNRCGRRPPCARELERKAIIEALQRTHGHKARAAELLGPHAVSALQPPEALPHRGVSRIARVADGASRHPPRSPVHRAHRRAAVHDDVRKSTSDPLHRVFHRIFRHFRRCDDLAASMQSPMSSPSEDSVMNRVLVVLTTIATILGTATEAGRRRRSPATRARSGSNSNRERALAAWRSRATSTTHFHGASPTFGCRLTVSTRTGRSSRPPPAGSWETYPAVVAAISTFQCRRHAATYRASVQKFDRVTLEALAPQAP